MKIVLNKDTYQIKEYNGKIINNTREYILFSLATFKNISFIDTIPSNIKKVYIDRECENKKLIRDRVKINNFRLIKDITKAELIIINNDYSIYNRYLNKNIFYKNDMLYIVDNNLSWRKKWLLLSKYNEDTSIKGGRTFNDAILFPKIIYNINTPIICQTNFITESKDITDITDINVYKSLLSYRDVDITDQNILSDLIINSNYLKENAKVAIFLLYKKVIYNHNTKIRKLIESHFKYSPTSNYLDFYNKLEQHNYPLINILIDEIKRKFYIENERYNKNFNISVTCK